MPKYPCRNCVYFKECGENMRVMPCDGRKTKREEKQIISKLKSIENSTVEGNELK